MRINDACHVAAWHASRARPLCAIVPTFSDADRLFSSSSSSFLSSHPILTNDSTMALDASDICKAVQGTKMATVMAICIAIYELTGLGYPQGTETRDNPYPQVRVAYPRGYEYGYTSGYPGVYPCSALDEIS
ncbi:hypothetical protein SCP_0507980 [Sparassis crispa]|uniref:Uncharacterized protein n=1 Tax=Sparassis crispa TaxID=139825 RepID=A0A401GNG7_9APHY|nr:hypothetical protein SCP_0507980 [Sparassis crispa]GBE83742.1 hypothetical protein SCP_0507980 [Sparassis crispa]